MLWQESNKDKPFKVTEDVVDISFRIKCNALPVDHSWALYKALSNCLPWIAEDNDIGIHSIHVAASSNGWERPAYQPGNDIQLSKRTRLQIRIPHHRINEIEKLVGESLAISGNTLTIQQFQVKKLIATDVIFARSVASNGINDETEFSQWIVDTIAEHGIVIEKLLCGLSHSIKTPDSMVDARSVMIAGLAIPDAIQLQQIGLGPNRHLGCGLFLPHKSIAAVGVESE